MTSSREQREEEHYRAVTRLVKSYDRDLRSMIHYMQAGSVRVDSSLSVADIASYSDGNVGVIIIGPKWVSAQVLRPEAKGSQRRERLKRLMHELIHIAKNLSHDARSRKLGYFSNPARDTYSWELFESWEAA